MLAHILGVHRIIFYYCIYFEMEKQSKQISKESEAVSKIFACLQDAETLKILSFLDRNHNKLIFKGLSQEQARRTKQFNFDAISLLTDKLKQTYGEIVKQTVEGLLRGESRSMLIYGSDESKKHKILVGESQNAGLLFLILTELFQSCYDRQYEDKVTIKLSCWQYRDGQLSDVAGGTTDKNISSRGNQITEDLIEGKVVVGIPEIIIRNLKSALKIIKIYMKKVEEAREQKEEETQSLVFTIKLQIDNSYDKQGNPTEYLVPKLHLVKLANPFFAKNHAKQPQWFISLFNYVQSAALEKTAKIDQPAHNEDSEFSVFLREAVIKNVNQVVCFSCFTNKMGSNQSLTALKFGSYMQQLKMQPRLVKLNILQLKQQQTALEGELIKTQDHEQTLLKVQKYQWLQLDQAQITLSLQSILANNKKIMQYANYVEYQYANVFTIACDILEKYIFSEQVQDYFYAKKVNMQVTPQLKDALANFFGLRRQIVQAQNKITKKLANAIARLRRQHGQDKESKYVLNTTLKQKQIYEKLLQIYRTMSWHFLYQQNQQFMSCLLNRQQKSKKEEEKPTITANFTYYEPQQAFTYVDKQQKQNKVEPAGAVGQNREIFKKKRTVDEMEMMFTNSNASLCGRKFKK